MKEKKENELKRFLEFLSPENPKTSEELRKEFKKVVIRRLLKEARENGYKIFRSASKKIYLKETKGFNIESAVKERNFEVHDAYDAEGNVFGAGKLIVFSPKNWEKIRIVPMADVYWGDPLCDQKKLKKYIEWIRRDEHVFTFLLGNIFSDKLNIATLAPSMKSMEDILKSIMPKILFSVNGPNELKLSKLKKGFNPLEKLFGGKVAHFNDQANVIVKFDGNDHLMKIFAIHGKSNAIITGAKVNPLYNLLSFVDADIVVMANLKYAHLEKPQIISFRNDEKGLEVKKVYPILLPSFKSYYGSEDAMKGYPAQFSGQINIVFYRENGNIHVYSGVMKEEVL
jgi:hypothetical protein